MSIQQRTMGSIHTHTVPLYDVNRAFENARYLKYYSPSKNLDSLETHSRIPRKGHGTGKAAAGWRAWIKRHSVMVHPAKELIINLFDRSEEELARIAAYFCVETDKAARYRKQTESGVTSTQRVQRGVKISPEVRVKGEPLDMSEDRLRHVVAMFCVEEPEEAMVRRRGEEIMVRRLADLNAEACSQSVKQHTSVEGEMPLNKKKPNIILQFLRNMRRACFGK